MGKRKNSSFICCFHGMFAFIQLHEFFVTQVERHKLRTNSSHNQSVVIMDCLDPFFRCSSLCTILSTIQLLINEQIVCFVHLFCVGSHFQSSTLRAIFCILFALKRQTMEMLVLGTVPHPQKFVTLLMFQCGYFQVFFTKFSVNMLFHFEVTDGALKYSGKKTYIRKHSMIPSGQILLEFEGHTLLQHQQPVMNLYLWCIFIFQFHYFLVTLFRLLSL